MASPPAPFSEVASAAERLEVALVSLRVALERARDRTGSLEEEYVLDTLLDDAQVLGAAFDAFTRTLRANETDAGADAAADALATMRARFMLSPAELAHLRLEIAREPATQNATKPRS